MKIISWDSVRGFFFRNRGSIPIPFFIISMVLLFIFKESRSLYSIFHSWTFVCGLLMGLAGQGLRTWAIGYSGNTTRASNASATSLVTAGPYAYLRNPMYLGSFFIGLGAMLISDATWLTLSYMPLFFLYYWPIVCHEEDYLSSRFADDYRAYASAVPAWRPRITPYRNRRGEFCIYSLSGEWRTPMGFLAAVAVILVLRIIPVHCVKLLLNIPLIPAFLLGLFATLIVLFRRLHMEKHKAERPIIKPILRQEIRIGAKEAVCHGRGFFHPKRAGILILTSKEVQFFPFNRGEPIQIPLEALIEARACEIYVNKKNASVPGLKLSYKTGNSTERCFFSRLDTVAWSERIQELRNKLNRIDSSRSWAYQVKALVRQHAVK
jgi:protein-S-isoprenylcysteine O-methyltransferase Ste14